MVGAGIAGLHTARLLVAAGSSVIVAEARDRVGGRLLSRSRGNGALDLGATWYWPGESRIAALIEELDIATFDQFLIGDAMFQIPGSIQRMDGNPIDVPAGRFSKGSQQLAEAILAELPDDVLQLGRAISHVHAMDDACEVISGQHRFVARHVVLALPPALAASTVEFDPPLPEGTARLASLTPVWMGGVTKVVARYETPFWRKRGLAGAAISHAGPMRELHDNSGPEGDPAALFGFAPPTQVESPTVTHDQVLAQLEDLYGPEARHPVELVIHDWRKEAYTSPPEVERLDRYETYGHALYSQPTLGGRLHWASTETSSVSPGHIEGALAAAARAAQAILESD